MGDRHDGYTDIRPDIQVSVYSAAQSFAGTGLPAVDWQVLEFTGGPKGLGQVVIATYDDSS